MPRPLLAFALCLSLAALGSAAPLTYSAILTGAAENPAVPSPGAGIALVTIDTVADQLSISVSFSGLIGNSTVAHIHCCVAPPGNIGVATTTPSFPGFPTGVTSGSYSQVFDTTLASTWNAAFITANGGTPAGAEAALAAGLANGQAYFNLHSSQFGGGEIRGFLTLVPEPGTFVLAGAALVGLALARRRARQ